MDDPRQVHGTDHWTLTEDEITDRREGHRQARKATENLRVGDDFTVETRQWSVLYRRIDRVGRWYHEWVIDETGTPTHHTCERLREHTDHGSAKPRP